MESPKSVQSLCTVWRCLHSMIASLLKPSPKQIFEEVWPQSSFFFMGNCHFFGFRKSRCIFGQDKEIFIFSLAINCLSYLFPFSFQSFESRAGGNILLIMSVGPKKCYSPLCPVIQPQENIMSFYLKTYCVDWSFEAYSHQLL